MSLRPPRKQGDRDEGENVDAYSGAKLSNFKSLVRRLLSVTREQVTRAEATYDAEIAKKKRPKMTLEQPTKKY